MPLGGAWLGRLRVFVPQPRVGAAVSRHSAYIEGMTEIEGKTEGITPGQFHDAEGVEDWRVLGEGACTYFRTGSFAAGARLVQAISELPGLDEHSPDVDLRHDGVTVRLITITDDYYGMSQRDVELLSAVRPRRWSNVLALRV